MTTTHNNCVPIAFCVYLNRILLCRRSKGGSIEPHPTEKAIILNYTLEAKVFGEPGDPMLEDSKVISTLAFLYELRHHHNIYHQSVHIGVLLIFPRLSFVLCLQVHISHIDFSFCCFYLLFR